MSLSVEIVTDKLVLITAGPLELFAVRVHNPDGGFEWWFERPSKRVGLIVRRAIDDAIARDSSGASPPL